MDSSNSTYPYPIGIAGIAGLMLYQGVMRLLFLRSAWGLAFCGLFIVLGIGLLKTYQWARVVTIVFSILDVGNFGVALLMGFRYWHLMISLNVLSKVLFYIIIICYLLSSGIRLAFSQPVRDASAFAKKA